MPAATQRALVRVLAGQVGEYRRRIAGAVAQALAANANPPDELLRLLGPNDLQLAFRWAAELRRRRGRRVWDLYLAAVWRGFDFLLLKTRARGRRAGEVAVRQNPRRRRPARPHLRANT